MSHPDFSLLGPNDLVLPPGWVVTAAADTGTFMCGSIGFVSPDKYVFIVEEHPNYHYAGGEIELLDLSLGQWKRQFRNRLVFWTKKSRPSAYADPNSQFKSELRRRDHGGPLIIVPSKVGPELRTEITREYFLHGAIWFAPWLTIIPREFESARYPEHETAGGRFARLKEDDHGLDTVEHICAQHPRTKHHRKQSEMSLLDKLLKDAHRPSTGPTGDAHLGPL